MRNLDKPPRTSAKRRVTMRDVAEAAGVSAMTVSNVINGNREFVGAQTFRRVENAIRKLNYRVLGSGRSLKSGLRRMVGVIVVDQHLDYMTHPFTSRMVSGFGRTLSERNYGMVVQGLTIESFKRAFPFTESLVDACFVRLQGPTEERMRMLEALSTLEEPIVLPQETLKPINPDHCRIRQDDYGAGLLIADHLAARRISRLAVVVPVTGGSTLEERLRGIRDGFAQSDSSAAIDVIECVQSTFVNALAKVGDYLDRNPSPQALVGVNDNVAFACLRAAQDRGLRVPQDIAVAGFNGFEPPEFTNPSLTTIQSRAHEIGVAAARAIIERLETGAFAEQDITLSLTLRRGAST